MIAGLAQHGCEHRSSGRVQVNEWMWSKARRGLHSCLPEAKAFLNMASLGYDARLWYQSYMVHCNCMIVVLVWAWRLEKVKLFIRNMPVEPGGPILGILLGAYGNGSWQVGPGVIGKHFDAGKRYLQGARAQLD